MYPMYPLPPTYGIHVPSPRISVDVIELQILDSTTSCFPHIFSGNGSRGESQGLGQLTPRNTYLNPRLHAPFCSTFSTSKFSRCLTPDHILRSSLHISSYFLQPRHKTQETIHKKKKYGQSYKCKKAVGLRREENIIFLSEGAAHLARGM